MMARLLLVALLTGGLIGCSGGGGATPEGFERASGDGFSFAYPSGWEAPEEGGGALVRVVGPADVERDTRPLAQMEVDPTYSGELEAAVDGIMTVANTTFENLEQVSNEEVEVAGAEEARLVESSWTAGELRIRGYDLFAVGADGRLYYLVVNAAEDVFDEERFRAIIDSAELAS